MAQIYAGLRRKQGGKKGGVFFLCGGVKTEIRTPDVDGGGAQDLQGIGGEGRGGEEHGENGEGCGGRKEELLRSDEQEERDARKGGGCGERPGEKHAQEGAG